MFLDEFCYFKSSSHRKKIPILRRLQLVEECDWAEMEKKARIDKEALNIIYIKLSNDGCLNGTQKTNIDRKVKAKLKFKKRFHFPR